MGIETPDFFEDVEDKVKEKKEEENEKRKKEKKEEKKLDEMTEEELNKKSLEIVRSWSNKIKYPDTKNLGQLDVPNSDDNLPGQFEASDFKFTHNENSILCTFRSIKGDVNIHISNFDKPKEGEPEKKLAISISAGTENGGENNMADIIKSIPELKDIFPDGQINTQNARHKEKLVDLINKKVDGRGDLIDGYKDREENKDEQKELQRQKEELKKQNLITEIQNIHKSLEDQPKSLDEFLNDAMNATGVFAQKDIRLCKAVHACGIILAYYTPIQLEEMLKTQFEYDDWEKDNKRKNIAEKRETSGPEILEYLSKHADVLLDDRRLNDLLNYAQSAINPDDYETAEDYIKQLNSLLFK